MRTLPSGSGAAGKNARTVLIDPTPDIENKPSLTAAEATPGTAPSAAAVAIAATRTTTLRLITALLFA
jgi:hypothetical protein